MFAAHLEVAIIFLVGYVLQSSLISTTEIIIDEVDCGPADQACQCNPSATACHFQLYVDLVPTFTRFNTSLFHFQGERMYIDEKTGKFTLYAGGPGICYDGDFVRYNSSTFCVWSGTRIEKCIDEDKVCTGPITVDSKTFRMVYAINTQFPGPTLIVHKGQIVMADIHNNLSSEAISIHWHGQHQVKTNFMDGVGLVTQCPIQPGTSFRYIFEADPSGTFWYHSHMGSQRTNGLFGALIVKEKELKYPLSFIDDPANHTINLMDWYQIDVDNFIRTENFGIGAFPNLPPYTIPSDTHPSDVYLETLGSDFAQIGNRAFWAGLMNGKGRYSSVPYNQSSLKMFEVERGNKYRFRLIHSGSMYGFRFSVDGHSIKVMATDGYLVDLTEVDYISLHSGERYDFILETDAPQDNYWMLAETFEIELESMGPPYTFYEHRAEAILHYSGANIPGPLNYGDIARQPKNCTKEKPCLMLNCPVGEFHPSYNIKCVSITELRLIEPTPNEDMPGKVPDITYFINMAGYVSNAETVSSINDKNFIFPQFPLTTYNDNNDKSAFCDATSHCNTTKGCKCTTVTDFSDNVTVRMVLSTVGIERNATHSMHLHGHSVHLLKIGYGNYSSETGSLMSSSRGLTCTKDGDDWNILDNIRCPNPRFRSPDPEFTFDRHTVRKDTIILPAGGYFVVQFRSNNPGYWFLHCHIDIHQREGMVLIMREAVDKIHSPPDGMKSCGTFLWDLPDFLTHTESSARYSSSFSFTLFLVVILVSVL